MMFNFQDTNAFELILGDFMRVNTPVPHELYKKTYSKRNGGLYPN